MSDGHCASVRMLRSILKNGMWGVIGTGSGRILNLLAMIFLARSLNVENYGYFGLIQSTLGVFGVFAGAGLGITAVRYVAEFRRPDPVRAGRIIGLVQATGAGTILIVTLIAILSANRISASLVSSPARQSFAVAFAIGAVFFAILSWRGIQDSILMGLEMFRDAAAFRLGEGLLVLAFMPILAWHYGLAGAVAGQALATAAVCLVAAWQIARILRAEGIRPDWRGTRHEWRILARFSLPSFLSNLVGTPVLWLGIYILSQQPDGIRELAFYNAAYQWHGPLIFIPMALCAASIPPMVNAWTSGQYPVFRRLLLRITGINLVVGLVPTAILIAGSGIIMQSYGPEYVAGQAALVWLLFAAVLHATANLFTSALQSMNRAWVVLTTNSLWGVVFVISGSILIPGYGATGLAATFTFAYASLVLIRGIVVILFGARP